MLKNAFDAFDQEKNGFIGVTMVGTILGMLGHQLDEKMLNEVVAEVDEDGSGVFLLLQNYHYGLFVYHIKRRFRIHHYYLLVYFAIGQIEFEEFCTLAARFLVEEDAEAMQQELKEAFRLYDKEGIHNEYNRIQNAISWVSHFSKVPERF